MPFGHGEVKISNPIPFTMPTSSSPRRQVYIPRSYKTSGLSYGSSMMYSRSSLRATSLDRNSSVRESAGFYRTTDSYLTPSYKYGNSSSIGRSMLHSFSSGSTDSTRKYEKNDILSRVSSLNNSTTLKHYGSRKSIDAFTDYSTGNPVLTNYKDLNEGSSYSESKRFDCCSSNSNSASSHTSRSSLSSFPEKSVSEGEVMSPLKNSSLSGSSDSSSYLSSMTKADVDENSNRYTSKVRTRYDANHNLLSKYSTGMEEKNNLSTYLSPHLRQQSSSSSSSPASSTDDVSEHSGHRLRRSSIHAGSNSGFGSSDHASTSSSYSARHLSTRENLSKGGLVGLRNLGNTCFMNSVLQCLSNTKPLLDYCLKDAYLNEINVTISSMKGALFKAFATLLHSLWKGSSTESAINPQSFKNQIQKFAPRFTGYSQQDAQEFLRYLLQGLHEDVNTVTTKPKPYVTEIEDSLSDNQKALESWRRYLRLDNSRIVGLRDGAHYPHFADLFVGQLKSTLHCTVCSQDSVTFDPFWDLSLPIPKAAGQVMRLQQCFDLFTREEILDGDEKPTCSKCKTRRKCTKSLTIHKFPKILVIHLKRFSPLERYRSKLSTHVDFPAVGLDLSPYASSNSRNPACSYNLYAVSNHSGTIYSGHYTAYCKHPYSGEWHDFNDSKVSSLSQSSLVTSEAYVLFYELANQNSHL